ncbi:hypothetical protein [Candidatus Magnetobacterium casense]|uniref:Uncharacterized protein n=1 Tax=Candidatus Magnetobacterium casense TaxID=1455061 RepID=A0ABS6S1H6_9BACT|nr:hypothetical protein [Candidatus Magnetobacterium casensis]MBV6342703.1 hypothetical protein [Candidatus Magnetobacterium casensis]
MTPPLFEKDAGGRVILNNQYADKIGDILVRSQSQPWSLTAEDKAMLRDFQAKTADIQISTPVGATTERLQQMKDYADTLDYRAQAGNEDSYSLKSEKTERIAQSLKDKAVPFRSLELTPENWRQEFGDSLTVDTPIGRVKMGENQYAKLLAKNRGKHFGLIKPTLTEPL